MELDFLYLKKILSPSRSIISKKEYKSLKNLINSPKTVLNVGSGSNTILGSKFWDLIPKKNTNLINLDLYPGSNVDVVCDACNMPFDNETFDLVVCQALLEHVENPLKIIEEIHRVLKKGGNIYCTVPFLQGYHADPKDFQRFTLNGMEHLLNNFIIVQKGISSGPFSAIAWIIRDILTFGKKKSFIYNFSRLISSSISLPVSLIDYVYPRIDSFTRNASEYYYLAKSK
tara:strand:+ start:96 stop:782 length:687 start_codon:yes stop_codon:yes gene_type:complete